MKNLLIIGAGKSGLGACRLASMNNYNIKVTDGKEIDNKIKKILDDLNVSWEENIHSLSNLKWADLIVISPGVSSEINFIFTFILFKPSI